MEFVEMMRIPFIVPTLIFFLVFWFFTITPKIKWKKLQKLKQEGIQVKGKFIDTITDYSMKINGRPGKKAIIEVKNPHTGMSMRVESDRSFDPYFSINIPQEIDVYFDRHDPNSYVVDIIWA